MSRSIARPFALCPVAIAATTAVAVALGHVACTGAGDLAMRDVPLAPDREEKLDGQPLSASTQSVNRYRSVLGARDRIDLVVDRRGLRLRAELKCAKGCDGTVALENIDAHMLVPLLPYEHGRTLDGFDKLVLMLAEYSRNGVELAVGGDNRAYGSVRTHGLFNDDEEYTFEGGAVKPNPGVKPKRMSLVNNCLFPGLWEVAAADSVGEMYHAWFTLPERGYFDLLRATNGLSDGDDVLRAALGYQKQIPEVPLQLDRLRTVGKSFGRAPVRVAGDKPIASYSTQDSRRKVQRHFYTLERGGKPLEAKTFAELQPGDEFVFHSFVPPGIYVKQPPRKVPYEPIWTSAELVEVTPKTRFAGRPSPHVYTEGALELTLRSADGKRALVVGNLPIDLLVTAEDFDIPGFGVGVLRASEPIEKRYLYLKDGPAPVYAFSAHLGPDEKTLHLSNNHEEGLEQIYLRAVKAPTGEMRLRVTLVAYERIVDLLELELDLPAELAARVARASARYQRPLWRSFSDSNLL
jgi:hypothetical protein